MTIFVGLVAAACSTSSDGKSGTTGSYIRLKTRVEVESDPTRPKTNALGWDVSLTKAYLSIGALYYYAGEPVLSRRIAPRPSRPTALAWLSELLVKPAHAHPGHYVAGAAMGQMLEPASVDLLGGPSELGDGEGVTGATNSARFTWQSPAQGAWATELAGQVILTQGTATKGDQTVRFIAKASESALRDKDGRLEVAGCAFGALPGTSGVVMQGDGVVTLTLLPSVWFDQVEFAYVMPTAEGAPRANADGWIDLEGTMAWQGFLRGVKKGTAYQFAFTDGEGLHE